MNIQKRKRETTWNAFIGPPFLPGYGWCNCKEKKESEYNNIDESMQSTSQEEEEGEEQEKMERKREKNQKWSPATIGAHMVKRDTKASCATVSRCRWSGQGGWDRKLKGSYRRDQKLRRKELEKNMTMGQNQEKKKEKVKKNETETKRKRREGEKRRARGKKEGKRRML